MLRMVIRVISAHRKHMVREKRVKSSAAASSIENYNANLSINGQTTDKYTATADTLDRWAVGPGTGDCSVDPRNSQNVMEEKSGARNFFIH